MSELERASKRHCWPTASLAEAYEAGFQSGAAWQRERDAKVAWSAVRNAAEKMDHADECALMADFAESAIRSFDVDNKGDKT